MKKLIELGNRFVKKSYWTDYSLTKLCLCSLGILIGTLIPKGKRKEVRMTAALVFLVTYIPLMKKVFEILDEMKREAGRSAVK